jgi:D-alanyl-D-alanine carboxypeptidase/D-alanyl-D-alanine-endopeptidase (penicillin-binding protein 4)
MRTTGPSCYSEAMPGPRRCKATPLLLPLLAIAIATSCRIGRSEGPAPGAPIRPDTTVTAHEATMRREASDLAIRSALRDLIEDPALLGASIGVHVVDAEGHTVVEHDADLGLLPASNLKLLTAAVALETFGAEHRFRTRLVATGPIEAGVVHGDLVLVGSGDPSFGAASLARLLEESSVDRGAAGNGPLRAVRGNLLGDDDCLPDAPDGELLGDGWSWNDEGAPYAPQIGGLCYERNRLAVTVRPGAEVGDPVSVEIDAPRSFARIVDLRTRTAPAGSPDTLGLSRRRTTNDLRITGELAIDAAPRRLELSAAHPTRLAIAALRDALEQRGVAIAGAAIDQDDVARDPERFGDATLVASVDSPPLAELLVPLLAESDNLYGEQMLRLAARHAGGSGSIVDATAHARSTLARLGVDTSGLAIADGSGLSRLDVATARQIATLLDVSRDRPWWRALVAALPLAGFEGTLAAERSGRFIDGPARGRVRAKTGSMRRTTTLSGYVFATEDDARAGRDPALSFSILVDRFSCSTAIARARVDRFLEALTKQAGVVPKTAPD